MSIQTESLFMLLDRMEIALLKAYHYGQAGNKEAATLAQEQADDLKIAGDLYIYEVATGKRRPFVKAIPRWHDHRTVEGKWAGKKAEMEEPQTIMECAGMLALTHARYWQNQTRLNNLKGLIDRSEGLPDKQRLEAEFCKAQRLTDIFNQARSDLITLGDTMFARLMEKDA